MPSPSRNSPLRWQPPTVAWRVPNTLQVAHPPVTGERRPVPDVETMSKSGKCRRKSKTDKREKAGKAARTRGEWLSARRSKGVRPTMVQRAVNLELTESATRQTSRKEAVLTGSAEGVVIGESTSASMFSTLPGMAMCCGGCSSSSLASGDELRVGTCGTVTWGHGEGSLWWSCLWEPLSIANVHENDSPPGAVAFLAVVACERCSPERAR
jgi:hypothetical protein